VSPNPSSGESKAPNFTAEVIGTLFFAAAAAGFAWWIKKARATGISNSSAPPETIAARPASNTPPSASALS